MFLLIIHLHKFRNFQSNFHFLEQNGVAFAKRFSSSTSSQNLYMAQRFGIGSEENLGAIRINVPVYYI